MKERRLIMGMPSVVEIADTYASLEAMEKVFSYFHSVDARFSTYKDDSEITAVNKGLLPEASWSKEMKEIFALSEETKKLTNGYFDIVKKDGAYDPSGLVKGWAIYNAAELLSSLGYKNFCVDVGGDIEARGLNANNAPWRVGIQNPFRPEEIIKSVALSNRGIATSGTYLRGEHIYDPHHAHQAASAIKSITVVGENIYEADRFATAAFAMGGMGVHFIESREGLEGYMIDHSGTATMTSNFEQYVCS